MKTSKIVGISFIAPFAHLEKAYEKSDFSMVLTHLVEQNAEYRDFYRKTEKPILLDNSFFELGECLSRERVLEAAEAVKATCVVMTDGSVDDIDFFKSKGYEVMFVPLTLNDLIRGYKSKDIDKVGISCLSSQKLVGGNALEPLRHKVMELVSNEVDLPVKIHYKTHFLGATNANLLDLKKAVDMKAVSSIDTSLPVWAGMHTRELSATSPRMDKHCDFDSKLPWTTTCDMNIIAYKQCFSYGHLQLDMGMELQ